MTDKRTIEQRARDLGMTRQHFHRLRKEHEDFAALVDDGADDPELLLWMENRKYNQEHLTDHEVMRRRKRADMALAEEKAVLAKLERMQAEREVIPVSDVEKNGGRAMQALKDGLFAIAPKSRALLVEYVSPQQATEVEAQIHEIIRECLDKTADSLGQMK
jgi:DNA-binding transcriptional MerR regulator